MISAYKGVAHPWLCDVMGHMTTRHYVARFDDASYHFLNQVFGWTPGKKDAPGWADVKQTIEYHDEISTGSLLEVSGILLKVGGKSITTRYEMHNLSTDRVAASLESVSVYFDLSARKAISIPEALRHRSAPFVQAG